jgi:hypothetical protein
MTESLWNGDYPERALVELEPCTISMGFNSQWNFDSMGFVPQEL